MWRKFLGWLYLSFLRIKRNLIMNRKFSKSVVSGADLIPLFSLGELYVSDFLKSDEKPKYPPCKLELAFDPISKLVQLTEQPCDEAMWGSFYWYLSSTNPQMKLALKDVADKTIESIPRSKDKNVYLDIASNDGTLLSYVPEDFIRIGVDPSDYIITGSFDCIVKSYFSAKAFRRSKQEKARYISCCAMLYDLNNPNEFAQDVYPILEDDGIFVVQLSYTPLMIIQTELGNICHEHLCYYNLTSLKYLFEKNGFVIKDVELNNVNGGSIRVYLQKDIAPNNFRSPADRDIANIRIDSLLKWEEDNGYNSPEIYIGFYQKIERLREKTVNFIQQEKAKGKSIYGYAASTKSATVYQFFRLDSNLITKISDKQERKWGLRTIGSNIPICSDEEMRKDNPDYLLVGPWFFLESFKKREKDYLDQGGAFILTSPEFSIYKNEKN